MSLVMSKKQVGGVIKLLKDGKGARPVFGNMAVENINGRTRLAGTNSYMMFTVSMEHVLDEGERYIVPFDKINTRYKLAGAKDVQTESWILDNIVKDPSYPNLGRLMNDFEGVNKGFEGVIGLNADYLSMMSTIFGSPRLVLSIRDHNLSVNVSNEFGGSEYEGIVLPFVDKSKRYNR